MGICFSRISKKKRSSARKTKYLKMHQVRYSMRDSIIVPIVSGIILSGSRYVITGDVEGNIRVFNNYFNLLILQLWPIAKTGFSAPVLDVNYPGCQITCFVEYSTTLLYACTSQGNIIEVNSRNYRSELIATIENEVGINPRFHRSPS